MNIRLMLLFPLGAAAVLVSCERAEVTPEPAANAAEEDAMPTETFSLTSPAFKEGETIPARHTEDGPDLSPRLRWSEPPEGTMSFALVVDDPDAPRGTWVHWVAYGIPGDARELQEGFPKEASASDGILQGENDFGKTGYGGPAPPPGKPHRYFFKLYALDFTPELEAGLSKEDLQRAIEGHVLGEAQLMGRYGR